MVALLPSGKAQVFEYPLLSGYQETSEKITNVLTDGGGKYAILP